MKFRKFSSSRLPEHVRGGLETLRGCLEGEPTPRDRGRSHRFRGTQIDKLFYELLVCELGWRRRQGERPELGEYYGAVSRSCRRHRGGIPAEAPASADLADGNPGLAHDRRLGVISAIINVLAVLGRGGMGVVYKGRVRST